MSHGLFAEPLEGRWTWVVTLTALLGDQVSPPSSVGTSGPVSHGQPSPPPYPAPLERRVQHPTSASSCRQAVQSHPARPALGEVSSCSCSATDADTAATDEADNTPAEFITALMAKQHLRFQTMLVLLDQTQAMRAPRKNSRGVPVPLRRRQRQHASVSTRVRGMRAPLLT